MAGVVKEAASKKGLAAQPLNASRSTRLIAASAVAAACLLVPNSFGARPQPEPQASPKSAALNAGERLGVNDEGEQAIQKWQESASKPSATPSIDQAFYEAPPEPSLPNSLPNPSSSPLISARNPLLSAKKWISDKLFGVKPPVAVSQPKPTPIENEPMDTRNAAEALDALALQNPGSARANDASRAYEPPLVSAYAPSPGADGALPVNDPAVQLGLDVTGLREGIEAYRIGDIAKGDAYAAAMTEPLAATALEWSLLRMRPVEAGYRRIGNFVKAHPDWPMNEWLRKQAEELLAQSNPAPKTLIAYFQNIGLPSGPETPIGRLALARALQAEGDNIRANALARTVWREDNLSQSAETLLLKNFQAALTDQDHKYRADRLLYKNQTAAALRAANLANKDVQTLARIRVAANNEVANDKLFATIPPTLKNDPGLLFAKIQTFRRAKRFAEAANLMQSAPNDPALLIDGDEWWSERRALARKLLDLGDPKAAYAIASSHSARANDLQVEAEFHAGWIALRFVKDPKASIAHFDKAMELARTPISRARAAYWRGRAADALGEDGIAYYEKAALESTAFYGQLARIRLGRTDVELRRADSAIGAARTETVRAIELLYAVGAKNLAVPLVFAAAKSLSDSQQVSALGHVVVKDRDAKVSLTLGKLASQRGVAMDELAFPTYGVPNFSPFVNSAPLPIVYSIARQESAFDPKALSSAGAMGLMQMISSTARRTAQRVGVGFDPGRMTNDPTFNAQLGAAHLGDLLNEQRNSLILTFAAYNAGGGRVKEWIAAHGDPRLPDVDPIDWIELIPIAETRNYVQRVLENLTIYRARIGAPEIAKSAADPLRREARR